MIAPVRRLPLAVAALVSLAAPAQAVAVRGLETGITQQGVTAGSLRETEFRRIRESGATLVRIFVSWRSIAPAGKKAPDGFDATDNHSPEYDWSSLDMRVDLAAANGLMPLLSVKDAPSWASGSGQPAGGVRPDATAYGEFMMALARRYDGTTPGLAHVRHFQVWNEPNVSLFLAPQRSSVAIYRALLEHGAAAVRAVDRGNVVIAGGLFPFGAKGGSLTAIAPLRFMRELLCVSGTHKPRATCHRRAPFDVWSTHPYTNGSPTHVTLNRDDVSISDLGRMRALLRAARRIGHVDSAAAPRFWVTEFSWDTNPPDARGVPARLHARWVADALFRMWRAGVELVTWFSLRDTDSSSIFQSGLWYRCSNGDIACDRPKPALAAFRFPFVALPVGKRLRVWGRTPASSAADVVVEQRQDGRWRRLATLRAAENGIFTARVRRRGAGRVRARTPDATSRSFAPHRTPDRPGTTVFGN